MPSATMITVDKFLNIDIDKLVLFKLGICCFIQIKLG